MRKLNLIFISLMSVLFIFGCAGKDPLFNDPSTNKKKKEKVYKVNKKEIDMPVYFKLPSDKKNVDLKFEKKSQKPVTLTLNNTYDGWVSFGDRLLSAPGDKFGIVIDFVNSALYQMPYEDVTTVLNKFSPDNSTVIKAILSKKDNPTYTRMVAVDSQGYYNKEELKFLPLLNAISVGNQKVNLQATTNNAKPELEVKADVNNENSYKSSLSPDKQIINAAVNGQFDRLINLINSGGNINEIDPNKGDNALIASIIAGDGKIADLLIDKGINTKHKNNNGQSPLHLAANYGLYNTAKQLLRKGIKVNDKDNGGNTPLMYAAAAPYKNMVDLLLNNGANIEDKNNIGETPLLIASRTGNTETVKSLIENGANKDATDNNGNNAVMKAVQNKNLYTTQKLIDDKVNPNLANNHKITPLMVAVANNDISLTDTLLKNGIDVNQTDANGRTPLMNATINGNTPLVKQILEYNPDLQLTDKKDDTAFDMARNRGFAQIQRIIGQDIKKLELAAVDLFSMVAKNDAPESLKLLKAGANPNSRDKETGNTPLFTAVANNVLPMANLLLDNGADPNIQNNKGNTPIIVAITSADINMIDLLIQRKANVNVANNNGDTALLWATKLKNLEIVRKLLMAGADPNMKNNEGVSPFLIAYNEGTPEILSLLRAAGGYK